VWVIFGRTREAREEVCEDAEEVCSVRMVVLWAMQELVMVSVALVGRRMVLTREGELEVLMRTPWSLNFRLFSCEVLSMWFWFFCSCGPACGLESCLIRSELDEKEKPWLEHDAGCSLPAEWKVESLSGS
jgi:hypothetical protein